MTQLQRLIAAYKANNIPTPAEAVRVFQRLSFAKLEGLAQYWEERARDVADRDAEAHRKAVSAKNPDMRRGRMADRGTTAITHENRYQGV